MKFYQGYRLTGQRLRYYANMLILLEQILEKAMYEWHENLRQEEWDCILSQMKGHPLQSAMWGEARKIADQIQDTRWVAFENGLPVYLVRIEERYILGFLKIAWIPKGPVVYDQRNEPLLRCQFLDRLKKRKFMICCINPWRNISNRQESRFCFLTSWIDLTKGKENLWKGLHKQFRYDIKKSKKQGVIVEKSQSHEDIDAFYKIIESLSQKKNFPLVASINFMSQLMYKHNESKQIESYIFSAKYKGHYCGGAFIIRCGENIHYMWGAVDRSYSHVRIGEAIQWEIIEWALSKNCRLYDLEGISQKQNSGVDYFKKKIGGNLIAYPSIQVYPLNKYVKIITILLKGFLILRFRKQIVRTSSFL
ncbi:MAG TPA: GNAT family N-acetyltransferase [Gammaproteobacteria bacterium]|nr:GNAT family N-acetyltransferase [Gammaproteobacteria bacterium]